MDNGDFKEIMKKFFELKAQACDQQFEFRKSIKKSQCILANIDDDILKIILSCEILKKKTKTALSRILQSNQSQVDSLLKCKQDLIELKKLVQLELTHFSDFLLKELDIEFSSQINENELIEKLFEQVIQSILSLKIKFN
jgi:hypothetical protein